MGGIKYQSNKPNEANVAGEPRLADSTVHKSNYIFDAGGEPSFHQKSKPTAADGRRSSVTLGLVFVFKQLKDVA